MIKYIQLQTLIADTNEGNQKAFKQTFHKRTARLNFTAKKPIILIMIWFAKTKIYPSLKLIFALLFSNYSRHF